MENGPIGWSHRQLGRKTSSILKSGELPIETRAGLALK
jgi:hypothetical protein